MPILNWIGKDAVVNHDKDVPFRLLKKNKSKSVGDSENLIIEGDNLEALKALLPHYQNKIKCIYIDPPYNTGNEKWVYNDNVNSPKIKKWLGKVVGGSEEDLTSHDKWLCMMYPRLKLLKQLLQNNGVIFVSIDDFEILSLKSIMNEIFGEENFVDCIVWKKRYGGGAKEKYLVTIHEYVLFYAKNKESLKNIFVPLDEETIKRYYKLKDSNFKTRGHYRTHPLEAQKSVGKRKNLYFPIKCPDNSEILPDWQWRWEKSHVESAMKKGEIEFLKNKVGKLTPHTKQYLYDEEGIQRKAKAFSIIDNIYTQHGTKEISCLFGDSQTFQFAKPSELILEILKIANLDSNDIILDSFAGSGTTAHAVLKLNKEEKTNRKFILIEMESEICKKITSERVHKIIKGYSCDAQKIDGIKGGFQYAVLDKKLFNSDGRINDTCTFDELASYIYFTETKTILDTKKINKTLLDTYNDTEYHLIFDGIGKNNLDRKFLTSLNRHTDKVIYADKCTLDDSILEKYNTVFKQIPYEVREF